MAAKRDSASAGAPGGPPTEDRDDRGRAERRDAAAPEPRDPAAARALRLGTLAAFCAYGIWGLFPLYWKRLGAFDPVQILCHRIVWALAFTLLALAIKGRLGELAAVLRNGRRFLSLAASALFVTANWGLYIWAVNAGHVTESALGYYINPLFSVAFGAAFFSERLDRWTLAAVGIATLGIGVASVMLGRLPWIALVLAATFALYGVVKKKVGLAPLPALAAETLIAAPLALAYLILESSAGRGILGGPDLVAEVLLVASGAVTAVPLILFATAANRIPLSRMGFIQYVSPTGQLSIGLFVYHERLDPALVVAFCTVIAAVAIYGLTRRRS